MDADSPRRAQRRSIALQDGGATAGANPAVATPPRYGESGESSLAPPAREGCRTGFLADYGDLFEGVSQALAEVYGWNRRIRGTGERPLDPTPFAEAQRLLHEAHRHLAHAEPVPEPTRERLAAWLRRIVESAYPHAPPPRLRF